MYEVLSPAPVNDETIRSAFNAAPKIVFMARPFNEIRWSMIFLPNFGQYGQSFLVQGLMPVIGVTPRMLIPVYQPQQDIVTYGDLGCFRLAEAPFKELARILRKTIEVVREDGSVERDHRYLFTVTPAGEIIAETQPA